MAKGIAAFQGEGFSMRAIHQGSHRILLATGRKQPSPSRSNPSRKGKKKSRSAAMQQSSAFFPDRAPQGPRPDSQRVMCLRHRKAAPCFWRCGSLSTGSKPLNPQPYIGYIL